MLACLILASTFVLAVSSAKTVYAQKDDVCRGVELTGGSCTGASQSTLNAVITTAINIFSGVIGLVAVIMILFGGFKYVTAGGDSSKVTAAQHTIIYAIIGLIIVGLAQVVVRFVLHQTTHTNRAATEEPDEEYGTALSRRLYKISG